jgi:hypothetical protein
MLDRIAVDAFARGGIMLMETPKRDYAWSHDVYLLSEPATRDIEVTIHKGDYMGEVVYREKLTQVHFLDADERADEVMARFRETIKGGC